MASGEGSPEDHPKNEEGVDGHRRAREHVVEPHMVPTGILRGGASPRHLGTEPRGFFWMLADDLYVLSWCDVVARNPITLGLDAEAFGEFRDTAEAESSTHGRAV
jgi:hypothetical protein